MKKILTVLFAAFIISCSNERHQVTYTVYYPGNTVTKTIIINDTPYLGSDRGTNYLKVGSITGPTVIETSAPIELKEVKKLEQ
jgi:hypothetical protein